MTPWERATLALTLLAMDPQGFGGLVARARVSPVRDAFMAAVAALPMPSVRLSAQMTPQTLDGDIDLSATLSRNTLVRQRGVLDRDPSLFILPMAERADPYLTARLSQTIDAQNAHAFVALDEGADEDEAVPNALKDRAAFWVSLDGLALSDFAPMDLPTDLPALGKAARKVGVAIDVPEQLVTLAVGLGITSLRAPSFALRAAQAHAALSGQAQIAEADLTAAIDLVYAHRATQLPEMDAPQDTPPEPEHQEPTQQSHQEMLSIPQDILLDAIKAALPADVLARLNAATKPPRSSSANGSGAKRTGNRRGRPLPARAGSRSSTARVDLIATLRAAIPWQTIRKRAHPDRTGPIIHPTDLRHKRYQSLSDQLLIFAVDASGSAAMARLAEAKGAVELLLSEAYARRDHVALVSFRGTSAEVLLPPTRSLVQTKRRLAALPGGGGTPLASGLTEALRLAQSASQKGMNATIILLTDGRANVSLEGEPDRRQASEDAQKVAADIHALGIEALVIDTTQRPERSLKELAETMRASYIPLPRADAQRVSAAVTASLAG